MKVIKENKIKKYIHLSEYEIESLNKIGQEKTYKPLGLYFAYKTEWLKHILNRNKIIFDNNKIYLNDDLYLYKIKFKKGIKLLKIKTIQDVIDITEKYMINGTDNLSKHMINWYEISMKYDGSREKI
jgi:hypothetical protein